MRFPILLALLALGSPLHAQNTAPERFFVGKLESTGRLKIILRPGETVRDRGSGRVEADGTTVLDQIVERPGEEPRRRIWRLREVAPGKIAGSLTGAKGPVNGTYANGVLGLKYTMSDGVRVEQRLTFAADGRSAENRMQFYKFGMNVATLKGTIRRVAND